MSVIQANRPPASGSPRALFGSAPAMSRQSETASPRAQRRLLACIGDTAVGEGVMRHALAVAEGLGLSVTLARVLETSRDFNAPADPLEWQMRRNNCRQQLDRLVERGKSAPSSIDSLLLAGPPASELTRWARDHGIKLLALGTHEGVSRKLSELGSTAQGVLDRAGESVLLVPKEVASEDSRYKRILVPLDGSAHAESVLPIAVRIARAHDAQILLAHVVRSVEAIEGAHSVQPQNLRTQLDEHNERYARVYLERMADRVRRQGLGVAAPILSRGDPRSELRRLIDESGADLVVLSSHGRSDLKDVPCGSVTEYLATHAPAPLLVVRPNLAQVFTAAGDRETLEHNSSTPQPSI